MKLLKGILGLGGVTPCRSAGQILYFTLIGMQQVRGFNIQSLCSSTVLPTQEVGMPSQ